MSDDTRTTGASILLGVDALFLGSLLVIRYAAEKQYLEALRTAGVASPGWPDAGGAPGAALPWTAAGLVLLAAVLLRLRVPPHPLLILLAAAMGATLLVLDRMGATGAAFGVGRYGTLAAALGAVWCLHLLGAMVALARGHRAWRFVALQAVFGIGLAVVVFPA